MISQQISGADGLETAVLRKGRTKLKFISAVAHRNERTARRKWREL